MNKACTPFFSKEDADLSGRKWRLNGGGYARTSLNRPRGDGGRRTTTPAAHRMVLERMIGRPLTRDDVCDHINFNKLDNRRENLRLVDREGSAQHRRAYGKSGVRGVVLRKSGKWQAQAGHKGQVFFCGLYSSKEEAALAAAAKRKELGFLEN